MTTCLQAGCNLLNPEYFQGLSRNAGIIHTCIITHQPKSACSGFSPISPVSSHSPTTSMVCICVCPVRDWGPVHNTFQSHRITYMKQTLFWNDINHTQGRRETWCQRLGSFRSKYVSESRSPVSTALTWCKFHPCASCGSYIRSSSSHRNGRRHSLRDNNSKGRGAALQEQLFITREIKIIRQCGPPLQEHQAISLRPNPFFRWYLLRPTGLFSGAAMARDVNASRVCR